MVLSMLNTQPVEAALSVEERNRLVDEVIDQINAEFPPAVLSRPSSDDRLKVEERVVTQVTAAYRRRSLRPGPQVESELAAEISRRLLGLGFLDLLLPPARTDISEIALYSHGLLQIMRKGEVRFETVPMRPEAGEVWRVLDRLLGPQNKRLDEANPSVNAKLPSTEHNPGGGRIKALHPVIVPPGRMPSINIRLYEQKPVLPHWLIERQALSAEMMADLQTAMQDGRRILICGGTRTGKTTMLSALCNFLPAGWRILKIEDPEEIWIDRETVQTVEARPQARGTEVTPYLLADGVDDAMRMSPDYLIIGEVRDGRAAMSLFRALMTGHSGCCTMHAESPRETADRLAGLMGTDMGINRADALRTVASAIDLQVQIGIRHDKRRVISISQVEKELRNGAVWFNTLWRYDEASPAGEPRWTRTGEWKQPEQEQTE
jgi:pilus assembly protein CpaF